MCWNCLTEYSTSSTLLNSFFNHEMHIIARIELILLLMESKFPNVVGDDSLHSAQGLSLCRPHNRMLLHESWIETDISPRNCSVQFLAISLEWWSYFESLPLESPIRQVWRMVCNLILNPFYILTMEVEAIFSDKLKICMINMAYVSQ